MTPDLFDSDLTRQPICDGAVLLRGFVTPHTTEIFDAIATIENVAPFRHMITPGGFRMSVAMTNCGTYGWSSDRRGYRYASTDPLSEKNWPAMPALFLELAQSAAEQAGFVDFKPDSCLINRYEIGSRLSLHQDKNERDFSAPIVSVSLGISALFLFGREQRNIRPLRLPLSHGDVVVWGGPARLYYHGIAPLKIDTHPLTGTHRINLTFRKVD
ncbi:MAG: alpha-ketoglutarate-dependent dioxygenase AlkB [Verrucomicrobiaceae bacterium]|nr:alpha-ketoglutarate-dependent dioxygenase AlkB [Verrucomicrobiaceae bacterium]